MFWTEEQDEVINYIASGYNHCLVDSVAGSGKTSVIVEGIKRMRGRSFILLSFSTEVASTMARRTGKAASCHSLHSFGLRQVQRNTRGSVKVEAGKSWKLVNKYGKGWNYQGQNPMSFKHRVVELMKIGKMTLARHPKDLLKSGLNLGITCFYGEEKYAWELLKKSLNITRSVDFEDMLWLPCMWARSWKFERYDVVVIDEVQDCSASLLRFADLITKPGGRQVMTGDRHQNIYSTFAGSDPELFNKLENRERTKILNLTTSFRCSNRVCYEAQKYVPHIHPRADAPEGVIGYGRVSDINSGMVICRNNAPLIKLWIKMISSGKKANLIGRETGTRLIQLIKNSKASTIGKLMKYMDNRVEKAVTKLVKLGLKEASARRTQAVMKLKDEYEAIEAISTISSTVPGMIKQLEKIFSDKSRKGIVLQTIHKAKGQEVDDGDPLYFLDFNLIDKRNKTDLEISEARNLKYVGITRAKDEIRFVESSLKK